MKKILLVWIAASFLTAGCVIVPEHSPHIIVKGEKHKHKKHKYDD